MSPLAIQGNWWETLTHTQQVFWIISIIFSVLFLIQFVRSLVDLDSSETDNLSFTENPSLAKEGAIDASFSLLSIRSIIAFFTVFGWVGVLALNGGSAPAKAMIYACLLGFIAMFVVAYMMSLYTNFRNRRIMNPENPLPKIGKVHLNIPSAKSGYGKVYLKVHGAFKEMDAVTEGNALPSGATIRVVEVLDDNLLLVEPLG